MSLRTPLLLGLRLLAAADVLVMTLPLLFSFEGSTERLAAYGYPMPGLFLTLAVLAGTLGPALLVAGFKVRYAAFLMLSLFVTPMAVLYSLHSSNSWGELQWLLQLIRMLEPAFLVAALATLILEGGGALAMDERRERMAREEEERRLAEVSGPAEAPPAPAAHAEVV